MISQSLLEYGKRFVSMKTRRRIALTRVSIRRPTSQWRPLPNLLIIGTQRGGTSSLFKYLSSHPQCKSSLRKEIRFFTEYYSKGEEWYRAHFSMGRNGVPMVAFDATPDYLLDQRVAQRAADLLPDARIIALLRDPVQRALSHYNHNLRLGIESRTFEDALEQEAKTIGPDLLQLMSNPSAPIGRNLLRYSYIERGRYGHQLERWMRLFDRSQFLILRSEDLFQSTDDTYQRILAFLGLRQWRPPEYRNYSYSIIKPQSAAQLSARCRRILEEKLEDDKEKLQNLTGLEL